MTDFRKKGTDAFLSSTHGEENDANGEILKALVLRSIPTNPSFSRLRFGRLLFCFLGRKKENENLGLILFYRSEVIIIFLTRTKTFERGTKDVTHAKVKLLLFFGQDWCGLSRGECPSRGTGKALDSARDAGDLASKELHFFNFHLFFSSPPSLQQVCFAQPPSLPDNLGFLGWLSTALPAVSISKTGVNGVANPMTKSQRLSESLSASALTRKTRTPWRPLLSFASSSTMTSTPPK